MAHHVARRVTAALALAVTAGLTLAGCSSSSGSSDTGSSSGSSSSAGAADSSSVLGTPKAASGDPVVFGVLNLESGPVTFPETLLSEQAAVDYVNAYKGGIGGHPIKLVTCKTDGSPTTSQRCANQILDSKPVAILGATDSGSPGAVPVWERANLAYLGGVAFTPVEQAYANAVIFSSVSAGDNAAASVYAAKNLNVKTAAVIYTSDTTGTASAVNIIEPTLKNAGVTKITPIAIPPTASDVSAAVATAVGAHPDLIYIDAPAACPNILSSLKQLGNTAKLMGIDTCTSPAAIKGANGGADGLYFASPVLDPHAAGSQTALYRAVLAKYAPASISIDSLAAVGYQTVMNVQAALASFTTADLTTDKILAAFKDGQSHPNVLGHDYTCDGKALVGQPALCNAYQQIRQVKGTSIVVASKDWVTAGSSYTGQPYDASK